MRLQPQSILLLVLLVLLVALNVALERPLQTVGSSGPLVPGFATQRVARITIERPGGARLELVRDAGGDTWSVPARYGFPALAFAVDALCARVRGLVRADPVSEEAAWHARFGVGDGGTRLVFEDAAGVVLASLVQGAPPDLGSGSYVRLAGEQEVFRATRLAPALSDPAAWLDTRLLAFDPASVRGVSVSHEAGRIFHDLQCDEEGAWRVLSAADAPPAPRTLVERVLACASTLYFADVLKVGVLPEDGFGSPPETLLEIDVGDRVSLWIGAPTGAGVYPATNPNWPTQWVVALPSESAQVLFAAIEALDRRIDG